MTALPIDSTKLIHAEETGIERLLISHSFNRDDLTSLSLSLHQTESLEKVLKVSCEEFLPVVFFYKVQVMCA